MYFYKYNSKVLMSLTPHEEFPEISEEFAKDNCDNLYFLHSKDPKNSRRCFCVSDPSLFYLKEEGLNLLNFNKLNSIDLPQWILSKIDERKVKAINTAYPDYKEELKSSFPSKWNINIVGMGDVGGTLLIGLKLLGKNLIDQIGIYSNDVNALQRWEYEANQVAFPFDYDNHPMVKIIEEKDIFNADMFVFCASKNVPSLDSNVSDVRMAQFEENCKILEFYSKKARSANFKGIFAVVSDPVDLLCKYAFLSSNKNEDNVLDFKGLPSDKIRGYGLGVMNARALYYSQNYKNTLHYKYDGRAFGPHGKGLIVADSIDNYNEEISDYLTEKAMNANIDIRNTGYKPYLAPALSSGAISLIATISNQWHYSSTYMGGVFMGSNNRLNINGNEIERLNLPITLISRLEDTYNYLKSII